MAITSCRIFISYRGESEGETFAESLYQYLIKDPMWENRYGHIHYSPYTKSAEVNFKNDIPQIMRDTQYFIMPLTENYYSGFWDMENDCPNENSITYLEVMTAIKNKCRFICIGFPGFEVNKELMHKLFGGQVDDLLCLAPLEYDPQKEDVLFKEISSILDQTSQEIRGMSDFLHGLNPNAFLSFKEETEDSQKYPFYEKLYDVKRITLLNLASSSFISGIDIASAYEESDKLKRWFAYQLIHGQIEANIVLTNPHSYAAQDAAAYKMYPSGLAVEKCDIILKNMNSLFQFIHNHPDAKLNIYLTDIVLPYGLMLTEHRNPANNHLKVDIYAPVISDDKKRPSFYLLKSNTETEQLYAFFEENVKTIMHRYSFVFKGHPNTSWLLGKPIIHRGVIRQGLQPHTQEAFDACIVERYPMEVDLLILCDGTVVVGRSEQEILCGSICKPLRDCTKKDIRIHNKQCGSRRVFTLDEFLDYVNGKVPVLLEIKVEHSAKGVDIEKQFEEAKQILRIVQNYMKRSPFSQHTINEFSAHKIAFHSSDPHILKLVKEMDCMIPCGLISMDYSRIREEVGEDFFILHATAKYLDIVSPDFISYNVHDLQSKEIRELCTKLNIPLLGWTVTDEDSQNDALDYGCQNFIIEGCKSYI